MTASEISQNVKIEEVLLNQSRVRPADRKGRIVDRALQRLKKRNLIIYLGRHWRAR